MRTIQYRLALALSIAILALCTEGYSQTQDVVEWPDGAKEKIEELLAIKREAMQFARMRSPDGMLGKRSAVLMEEIGHLVSDTRLIKGLEKIKANSLHARISLWAADKLKRPDEYDRFAEWYVNQPEGGDLPEYYHRAWRKNTDRLRNKLPPELLRMREQQHPRMVIPRVLMPNDVDKEDILESNRFIMEYSFFVPPCGRPFEMDDYRLNMAEAMAQLDNPEDSLIVLTEDCSIHSAVNASAKAENDNKSLGPNAEGYYGIFLIASIRSFEVLARFSEHPATAKLIQMWITTYFTSGWFSADARIAHHARWTELANRNWQKPSEIKFAKDLKAMLNQE